MIAFTGGMNYFSPPGRTGRKEIQMLRMFIYAIGVIVSAFVIAMSVVTALDLIKDRKKENK